MNMQVDVYRFIKAVITYVMRLLQIKGRFCKYHALQLQLYFEKSDEDVYKVSLSQDNGVQLSRKRPSSALVAAKDIARFDVFWDEENIGHLSKTHLYELNTSLQAANTQVRRNKLGLRSLHRILR